MPSIIQLYHQIFKECGKDDYLNFSQNSASAFRISSTECGYCSTNQAKKAVQSIVKTPSAGNRASHPPLAPLDWYSHRPTKDLHNDRHNPHPSIGEQGPPQSYSDTSPGVRQTLFPYWSQPAHRSRGTRPPGRPSQNAVSAESSP